LTMSLFPVTEAFFSPGTYQGTTLTTGSPFLLPTSAQAFPSPFSMRINNRLKVTEAFVHSTRHLFTCLYDLLRDHQSRDSPHLSPQPPHSLSVPTHDYLNDVTPKTLPYLWTDSNSKRDKNDLFSTLLRFRGVLTPASSSHIKRYPLSSAQSSRLSLLFLWWAGAVLFGSLSSPHGSLFPFFPPPVLSLSRDFPSDGFATVWGLFSCPASCPRPTEQTGAL